jgi:hypothetical protein
MEIIQGKLAPAHINLALLTRGGKNRLGGPMFRCIWGRSRLSPLGGKWEHRDANTKVLLKEVVEVRMVPKYVPQDRWYIEVWMPPETYGSPEQWEQQFTGEIPIGTDFGSIITLRRPVGIRVQQLGPYPSDGEYEMCYRVETNEGGFLDITSGLACKVVDMVLASRNLTDEERMEGIKEAQRLNDKEWDRQADAILHDAG